MENTARRATDRYKIRVNPLRIIESSRLPGFFFCTGSSSRNYSRSQTGTVLVMVLWVLSLLTLLGGYFAFDARIRRNLGQNALTDLKGREMVRSLLLTLSTRLAPRGIDKSDALEQGLFVVDGTLYSVTIGGENLSFLLQDENGKLDLNKSSETDIRDAVRGLLGKYSLEKADTVVDGLLDWKDRDKLVRLNGAEDDVYQDRMPPYYPANAPFRMVDELLLVNGVDREIFFGPVRWSPADAEYGEDNGEAEWLGGLRDLFTVYNRSGKVMAENAPLPLRELLSRKGGEGTSRYGVVLLKVWIDNRFYQVYWRPGRGKKKFAVIHWKEGGFTHAPGNPT